MTADCDEGQLFQPRVPCPALGRFIDAEASVFHTTNLDYILARLFAAMSTSARPPSPPSRPLSPPPSITSLSPERKRIRPWRAPCEMLQIWDT